jgi:hypothetical protein
VPAALARHRRRDAFDVQQRALHSAQRGACPVARSTASSNLPRDTTKARSRWTAQGRASSITQRICLSIADGTGAASTAHHAFHSNDPEESQ